jgi:Di-haem oxidoreductase, putative peroxidase
LDIMIVRRTTAPYLLAALLLLLTVGILGGNQSAPGFGDPLSGLDASETARFQAGLAQFVGEEHVLPDGLGPVFNAPLVDGADVLSVACSTCHTTPAIGGGNSAQFETRFGRVTNGVFDPLTQLGGSLMQNQGIGKGVWGYNFRGEVVPQQANVVAKRRTTPLFGAGLVEAVPDQVLMMLANQQQAASPDTAGRPSIVIEPSTDEPHVGRFGWKAQHALLFDFAGDAYLNEMGITTPLFPDENCPQGNCALLQFNPVPAFGGTVPNDTNTTLQQFADFMAFLAPPPIQPIPPAGRGGDQIFAAIGCAQCHLPTMQSGRSPVAALNNVVFHPFSDFLLHDMGSLGDGIVQGGTGATEMRTAPLWGLRNVTAFLHDGRAATVEAAILAHEGQASNARDHFSQLGPASRSRLIAFIKSL